MAEYKPTRHIDFLVDEKLCSRMLGQMRAAHGSCPRCGSPEIDGSGLSITKSKSESLLRCCKCGDSFAFARGTFVMGANQPLIRYIQLYVLNNALGEALTPSAACLAIGAKHGSVVKAMLQRIALVDPGISFAIVDAALARTLLPTQGRSTDSFGTFCDMNSILVDEDEFLRSLKIAISKQVPELIARYKQKGPRKSVSDQQNRTGEPPSPFAPRQPKKATDGAPVLDQDVARRKTIAFTWQKEFGKIAPTMSAKLKIGLAWRLANLNIATNEGLAALEPGTLTSPGFGSSSLLTARVQYLDALTRYVAVQKFVRQHPAEHLG